MTTRRIKIYFDGGCRPNPGRMETAVVTGGAAVVAQANGAVRARGGAAEHLAHFRALAEGGPAPAVRHIKRTQNLAGIALARGR